MGNHISVDSLILYPLLVICFSFFFLTGEQWNAVRMECCNVINGHSWEGEFIVTSELLKFPFSISSIWN